jgi:hypothetical protein
MEGIGKELEAVIGELAVPGDEQLAPDVAADEELKKLSTSYLICREEVEKVCCRSEGGFSQ